jgi:hypothetical protein
MGCASNNGGIPLERGSALHDPGPGLHLRKQSVRAWRSQAGFLPRGLIPSVDGRPSVSRRWGTEAFPKSGRLSNASSDVSRTSPTVFRPAANSAFFIRVGNRTSRVGVLSGSSGVGSSSLISSPSPKLRPGANHEPRTDEDSRRRTLPTTAPSSPPRGADSLPHSGVRFQAGLDSCFLEVEKVEIIEREWAKARARNPKVVMRVTVQDETDEGGRPRVNVVIAF